MMAASYDASTESAIFSLPTYPYLKSDGAETRTLKCCFAPARTDISVVSNWYELTDTLNIIPDPVAALTLEWKQNSVDMLDFSGPSGHAGLEGDRVVLQKENCENAHTLSAVGEGIGTTHSAPMTLEPGGVAFTFAIAQGKVNELAVGRYKMCFATKSSEFDAFSDFKMLNTEVVLTATMPITPSLVVPDSVHLGVDIVVIWNATSGANEKAGLSQPGSWVGLYKKGECSATSEWQHKCYLVAHELPAGESGGVVRFSQNDYKSAGEYEVRYFRGNSRSGQGQVCAGLQGTGEGTYVQCSLYVAATSRTIHVYGSIESQDDLASVPGLEHVVLV